MAMLKDTQSTPESAAVSLEVQSTLPVLAFDFEGLKAWATGLTERFAGLVVTEDIIPDIRRDMAEINRNKDKLETARKETVRRVSAPIKEFEGQIKEVVGIFDATYSALGSQVKAFEDAQREEKRKTVEALVLEEVDAAYGTDGPRPHIPVQDSWLNKSTSLKSVREAVKDIIEKDKEAERQRRALEQAKQDRAAAIEEQVKAKNREYGLEVPVSRFVVPQCLDLFVPLADAIEFINRAFAREVERLAAQKAAQDQAKASPQATAEQKSAPAEQAPPEIEQPTRQAQQTRAMSIVLAYDVACEDKVIACLNTLKTLCVNFGARYRQE